ncbi:MAG: hypothetical protein ACF8PG_09910 [Maioricimonas sp. JB045]|uniref:hypothetical protein n=1 Tax=Maioricimonas sp. JC845 TaxID=3232138 RepID=UPI0034588215
MIKKAILGTLTAAVIGGLVFGRDAASYVTTGFKSVRDTVRNEVPIEFELERAREMIDGLVPEIRKSMHVIAEEEVEIDRLRESIARREKDLKGQEEAILTLTSDLKSGKTRLVYSGRTYSTGEVQRDLSERFDRFKVAEDTLARERQILDAKSRAHDSHREKLERMLSAKKDLQVEIERLQARLRSVEAAETISELQIDDSHLTRCKSLVAELNKQLDVREKMLDADGKFTGLIPVEAEQTDVPVDIAEQVERYFGENDKDESQIAQNVE